MMQGTDEINGPLFSYVDLEDRVPARHPLPKIRQVANDALASLDDEFDLLYVDFGRHSIALERLIRARLLQILFSMRSERQLMEQMQDNLLFRWFVSLFAPGLPQPFAVTDLCLFGEPTDGPFRLLHRYALTGSASDDNACMNRANPASAEESLTTSW